MYVNRCMLSNEASWGVPHSVYECFCAVCVRADRTMGLDPCSDKLQRSSKIKCQSLGNKQYMGNTAKILLWKIYTWVCKFLQGSHDNIAMKNKRVRKLLVVFQFSGSNKIQWVKKRFTGNLRNKWNSYIALTFVAKMFVR